VRVVWCWPRCSPILAGLLHGDLGQPLRPSGQPQSNCRIMMVPHLDATAAKMNCLTPYMLSLSPQRQDFVVGRLRGTYCGYFWGPCPCYAAALRPAKTDC
jgi:hypothetical protein